MIMAGLSGLLAYICGRIVLYAAPNGWRYTRLGWSWIRGVQGNHDPRQDVEARRQLTMGGQYLLGGVLWLVATLISSALVIVFGYWTLAYLGLLPGALPL